ncbi:beta-lactamase family protein [Aquibacillus koreensis]|uniref:Beta-lactamase family protein n=1 Tax=Aquibacillus koreensis TaxID=279446 RepID=A0A9X3WKK3_9BACI|nr:serine hydrolase [Aquibacillus koreensis]MCT2536828.1 beta-lactamase family protein [Aquibacillus koreensis]MDC3421415.1 beta-lactamase family protein [Aquibacillus koreensis]
MIDEIKDDHSIREVILPYIKNKTNLLLTIGIYREGETEIITEGNPSSLPKIAPEHRIYEIGSITKVFTASLLAKAITEKKINLDDSITEYLPTLKKNITLQAHPVTIRHLTTHTSGLPSLPFTFTMKLLLSKRVRNNPYIYFTNEDMIKFLQKFKFNPEKRNFTYSNLGLGLLGYILAKEYGNEYENVIKQEITEELKATDTAIHLSASQKARLIPGFNHKNKQVNNWDFKSLEAAGALRSTITDQLAFLESHIESNKNHFNSILSETHHVLHEHTDGMHVGMNWIINKEKNVIWHNGGTAGYSSFMGFNKDRKMGVVVLSNYGPSLSQTTTVDRIGFDLLK